MKYIEVNNFRIFDEDNHFYLSPVTILTGTNSSGKSSLMKLFLLMKDAFENGIPKNELNFNSKEHFLGTYNGVLNDIDKDLVVRFHIPLLEILTRYFSEELIKFELENDFNNEDWVFELIYRRKEGLTSENACLKKFSIKNKKTNKIVLQWNYEALNEEKKPEYNVTLDCEFILKYFRLKHIEYKDKYLFNYTVSEQIKDELVFSLENQTITNSFNKCYIPDNKLSKLEISLGLEEGDWGDAVFDKINELIEINLINDIELDSIHNTDGYKKLSDFIFNIYEIVFRGFNDSFSNRLIQYLPSVRGNSQRVYSNESQGTIFNELLLNYANNDFDQEGYNEIILPFINKWLKKFEIGDEFKVRRVEGSVSVPYVMKNGKEILLADLGFGITQFIPILLKISLMIDLCLKDKETYYIQTLIIEEPESNIHPKLQSKLADLFVDVLNIKYPNIHLIVETHSEYLIRKLQVNVLKKNIEPKDISLYYFDNIDNVYSNYKIDIDNNGMLKGQFGAGFFDESADLMLQLLYPNSLN